MVYNLYIAIELIALFWVINRIEYSETKRRIKPGIITVFFFFFDLAIMYLVNYEILPQIAMLVMYVLMAYYVKKLHNVGWIKAIIDYVISFVIIVVIEGLVGSIVFYLLEEKLGNEFKRITISLALLFIVGVLAETILGKFSKIVCDIIQKKRVICTVLILVILIETMLFKLYGKLPIIQLFLLAIFAIILAIVIIIWQYERKVMQVKMEQYKMETVYNDAFQNVIKEIRRKQHDYKNQINAICSLHLTTKSYDELVKRIEEYSMHIDKNKVDIIFDENSSPIIVGFLYMKLAEAEERDIKVETEIAIQQAKCNLSEYKIAEIIGILMDNAMDAVEGLEENKSVRIHMVENESSISIKVANISPYISAESIKKFFSEGYSTKGKGRGLGLYNLKEIAKRSGSKVIVENINYENKNWFSIEIIVQKKN